MRESILKKLLTCLEGEFDAKNSDHLNRIFAVYECFPLPSGISFNMPSEVAFNCVATSVQEGMRKKLSFIKCKKLYS